MPGLSTIFNVKNKLIDLKQAPKGPGTKKKNTFAFGKETSSPLCACICYFKLVLYIIETK